ncbi:ComEC/Rec2 family competence protein [Halorubrum sp. FL23]|uniref:ComEC/Rec2 family competence protein n=1 Tax=Halorubrum sp. FL23 TaxID=3458704 RepID=UPI00403444DD
MTDVQVYIWNVERGDAILIKGPEENVVVDLGQHSNGFSPTEQMQSHGVSDVGFLLISHPDEDHIKDIPNFLDEYSGFTFRRPKKARPYIEHRKENLYPNKESYQEISEAYLEIDSWSGDVPVSPSDSDRNAGLKFNSYNLHPDDLGIKPADELDDDEDVNLNNLSFLTVMEYNGFKLLTMGDLEDGAIEQLLEKSYVRRAISGTDILVAPHHGRQSSYTSELFEEISPDIVAISDAAGVDSSASSQYSDQTSGKIVEKRDGNYKTRYSITTRNDGVLYFGIDDDGSYKTIID